MKAHLVLDLETNGCQGSSFYDEKHTRVVQVAVYCVGTGELFSQLVKPGVRIPAASTAIHRIADADVRSAPELPSVMRDLRTWIEDQGLDCDSPLVVVAHNAFGFDLPLLRRLCCRAGCPLPAEWLWLDTLVIARRLWDGMSQAEQAEDQRRWESMDHEKPLPPSDRKQHVTLSKVHARYKGAPLNGAHDAGVDVAGLAAVLPFLLPHAGVQDRRATTNPDPAPLPDTHPLVALRGVGPRTAAVLRSKLGLPNALETLGDLRSALAPWTRHLAEQERLIRLAVKPDDWVFSVLQAVTGTATTALLRGFPHVDTDPTLDSLPLDEITRRRLREEGIRTFDSLVQYFLFDADSDGEVLRAKLNLTSPEEWASTVQIMKREWGWLCPALATHLSPRR